MGRVAGAYGVRGWIKVERPQAGLEQCTQWWINGTQYALAQTQAHSGTLLAKLDGVPNREAAAGLKGAPVLVERAALPAPQEGRYYLADLLGLAVVNEQGERLGIIERMSWNGAHDVMELAGEKRRLLPWVSAVVKKVDLSHKQVLVDWGADW
jgi:16S rRNA processing protein RimM